ncbi:hypothetical protein HPB47_002612 [Ixodes persulcatus]|uniref:Uncharacterized protein n=1 Tax=Ixodes persulcatus TaxID=34615 RepID=A0AC60PL17_IXOPE|nr:hypothetical protein HPB47_002612 [Ixodes persulcatus]
MCLQHAAASLRNAPKTRFFEMKDGRPVAALALQRPRACFVSNVNRDILLANLEVLGFPERPSLTGKEAAGEARNVLHYLFTRFDEARALSSFRLRWPVDVGTSDKLFRDVAASWIQALKASPNAGSHFDDFAPQILLYPRHLQHMAFLANFSTFVLCHWLGERAIIELPPTADAATLSAASAELNVANAAQQSKLAAVREDEEVFLGEQEKLALDLTRKNELLRQQARSFGNLEEAEASQRLRAVIDELTTATVSASAEEFDGSKYTAGEDCAMPLNITSLLEELKRKNETLSGRLGEVNWSKVRHNVAAATKRLKGLQKRLDSARSCRERQELLQAQYGEWAAAATARMLEGQPPFQVQLPDGTVFHPPGDDLRQASGVRLMTEQEVEDTLALILQDVLEVKEK